MKITFFEWLVLKMHGAYIGAKYIQIMAVDDSAKVFFLDKGERLRDMIYIPSIDFDTLKIIHRSKIKI